MKSHSASLDWERILVTGGAGFIGSHVVELLRGRCREVLVLDDFSAGSVGNLPPMVRTLTADIRDRKQISRCVTSFRPDVVVHLAAQPNVRRSIDDPALDAETNVLGGVHLLQACAESKVRRVVFASSGGAVYGEQSTLPAAETAIPNPASPYALSKLTLEAYGRYFTRSEGLEFVALRLANVYGPRQDPRGEAGVIAIFLEKLRRGHPPTIFGDGTHTRDYVWVGDVARAFLAALGGPPGVYNVGTGVETATIDIFRQLRALTGSPCEPQFAPEIPGEVHRNALDCTRARTGLGWSPTIRLPEGLELMARSAEPGVVVRDPFDAIGSRSRP